MVLNYVPQAAKVPKFSSESDIIAKVEAAENKITKDHGGGNVYYGQIILCNFGKEKMHGYGTYTGAYGWKYMGTFLLLHSVTRKS